jgi:unsaturated pyranuronate lyase
MAFVSIADLARREPFPGYEGRFLHGDGMSVAHWVVKEGSGFPEHRHPHEQIAMVVEGRFEMTVAGETRVLDPGTAAVIPSGVPHSGRALTPCRLIDVFQPVREDYR